MATCMGIVVFLTNERGLQDRKNEKRLAFKVGRWGSGIKRDLRLDPQVADQYTRLARISEFFLIRHLREADITADMTSIW
jgi:hypothetical protein